MSKPVTVQLPDPTPPVAPRGPQFFGTIPRSPRMVLEAFKMRKAEKNPGGRLCMHVGVPVGLFLTGQPSVKRGEWVWLCVQGSGTVQCEPRFTGTMSI